MKSTWFSFQHPPCLVQSVVVSTTVGPRTETGNVVCFSLCITVRSCVVTASKPLVVESHIGKPAGWHVAAHRESVKCFCCILRFTMRVGWGGSKLDIRYKQYNFQNQPKPVKARRGCGCTLDIRLDDVVLTATAGEYQCPYFATHTASTMTQCKYLMPATSLYNQHLSF